LDTYANRNGSFLSILLIVSLKVRGDLRKLARVNRIPSYHCPSHYITGAIVSSVVGDLS
jgi:hypothetical protein